MLHIEQDDPPVQPDTLQVTSSAEASLPGCSISDADLARLVADQEENRRDEEALREQQERFEAEESRYYEGVEAVVAAEVELQTSRACQNWDDWAVWDEMNRPRSRKRAFLEVTVSAPGDEGGGQRWSVPFDPNSGQQVVLKFHKLEVEPEEAGGHEIRAGDHGDSAGSDASTIPAASGALPREPCQLPACGVPLEFQQFQMVCEQWNAGQLSNDAVKQRFGVDTLELLETQKIVLGADHCRGHSAWNGSSMEASHPLRGEGNGMMSGGPLLAQHVEGKPSGTKENGSSVETSSPCRGAGNVLMSGGPSLAQDDEGKSSGTQEEGACTDTLLDEMLATCKSTTEASSYFVETGLFHGEGALKALSSGLFRQVISIEVNAELVERAREKLKLPLAAGLLKVVHDDSCNLWHHIQDLHEPCTFFLDAHGYWVQECPASSGDPESDDRDPDSQSPCPLLAELEAIAQHPLARQHKVLIDDRRCLQPGWEHPTQSWWRGLTEEMVLEKLRKVNPDFQIQFIDGLKPQDIIAAVPPE
ncbi:unnamed protein product [Symbiodinium necroappetens]|uniref:Uncharacterized protein n=1 Tax=Symbiodinium necroappetens TaxID=1628268 RepID=A0A812WSW5_9DINO|nr:unnamed protein product [Symbiodinium necroappetens]